MAATCAYSIKTIRVDEPDFPYKGQSLTSTTELVDFVQSLQNADNEKFLALYLDNLNRLICIQVVPGIVNQAIVYPREVLRHALLVNASGMILVHNHPSGNMKPSQADISMTEKLIGLAKALEILIHDHLLIGGGSWYSMREEGIVSFT